MISYDAANLGGAAMVGMRDRRKTLKPGEVTEIYGLSSGTLANMRCRRVGPKFYKVNRSVLYRVEDLEAWLTAHPVLTKDSLNEK